MQGEAMRAGGWNSFDGDWERDCADVERACSATSADCATIESGGPRAGSSDVPFDLPPEGIDLDALERRLVEQALHRTAGNKTRAGALLGLTRDQVRYRMQKYELDRDG